MKSRSTFSPPLFCLVCGIDSGPVRTFLLVFIGALVGASVLILVWSLVTGRLKDSEEISSFAIEAESNRKGDSK